MGSKINEFPRDNSCGIFFNEILFSNSTYEKYNNLPDPSRYKWYADDTIHVLHENNQDEMIIFFQNKTVKNAKYATINKTTSSNLISFIRKNFVIVMNPNFIWKAILEPNELLFEGTVINTKISLTIKTRGDSTIISMYLYEFHNNII